jgi:type IV pilus assembly protein PilV
MKPHLNLAQQRGLSLIEVLVSLLILVLGLLGMIGLQARAQIGTFESYQRGQALIIAQDMADRLMINRLAVSCYAITTDTAAGTPYLGTGYTGTPTCVTTAGTAAMQTLAANDLIAWNNALKGASETLGGAQVGGLLGARGCISFDSTTSRYRISVAWQGMARTVAPTAGDTAATCGKDLYGSEAERREVNITLMIATLS